MCVHRPDCCRSRTQRTFTATITTAVTYVDVLHLILLKLSELPPPFPRRVVVDDENRLTSATKPWNSELSSGSGNRCVYSQTGARCARHVQCPTRLGVIDYVCVVLSSSAAAFFFFFFFSFFYVRLAAHALSQHQAAAVVLRLRFIRKHSSGSGRYMPGSSCWLLCCTVRAEESRRDTYNAAHTECHRRPTLPFSMFV